MNSRLRPTVGRLLNDARFSLTPFGAEDVVRQTMIMMACYAAYDISRARLKAAKPWRWPTACSS